MRIRKPTPRELETAVSDWNSRYQIGTKVTVTRDDGSTQEAITMSAAWVLGGHSAVIGLSVFSGAYLLSRVRADR